MSIRFPYFPFLVQQMVMHQMDLLDVFSLYSTSKKSKTLAMHYFKRQECQLSYDMRSITLPCIRIKRNISSENYCYDRDQVSIRPMMNVLCFGTFVKSDKLQIPVNHSGDMYEGVLRFAQELFPKIQFKIDFGASPLEVIRNTMKIAKVLKVPVEKVEIGDCLNIEENLMRVVLTECSAVKILITRCPVSEQAPHFQYDFRTNPPFKFDSFQLSRAEWVTKDHLINLFFGCKKVFLSGSPGVSFNDQELLEICEKWLEASETEYLKFYREEGFPECIGKLPGAVPVIELKLEDRNLEFGSKKCYEMRKADGRPAIIYDDKGYIVLRTDFEDVVIGEGIDRPEDVPGQRDF